MRRKSRLSHYERKNQRFLPCLNNPFKAYRTHADFFFIMLTGVSYFMPSRTFIVTGTDTGIGKTVFAAALTHALEAFYWKPVQAGLENETDSQCVARLGQIPVNRIIPEAYKLALPASPHLAAAQEGLTIELEELALPFLAECLVVEGAGGIMVPLNRHNVYADAFARWQAPVILCARTTLGTINHTLLSLQVLRSRNIPVLGIAFIGAKNSPTEEIIAELGAIKILGCLPFLQDLNPATLALAFAENFSLADFQNGA